jgi:hypothetical protein
MRLSTAVKYLCPGTATKDPVDLPLAFFIGIINN